MLYSRLLEEPPHPPQADVLYHPDSYRESYFRVIKCARTNLILSLRGMRRLQEPPSRQVGMLYHPDSYRESYFRVIKCARTNVIFSAPLRATKSDSAGCGLPLRYLS